MKTSIYEETYDDTDEVEEPVRSESPAPPPAPAPAPRRRPETPPAAETSPDEPEPTSPELFAQRADSFGAERWTDEVTSEPGGCGPPSEMYYTASSEVSLLSDLEPPVEEPAAAAAAAAAAGAGGGVIAGHVAAMRERFESMTRANTPCPDLARSLSPSLDLLRNVTPSPDRLD